MKKLSYMLLFTLLLCGCGQEETADKVEMTAAEETTEAAKLEETTQTPEETKATLELHISADTVVKYDTVSQFLDSDFCEKMQGEGFATYLLSYDEERYEFRSISSDASFYEYRLVDTETEESVSVTISYDTYEENVEQFADNKLSTEGDVITTAEKDGVTYDVYLSKLPFEESTKYSLSYIPFENYTVYISSHRPTTEEVLEDFQAFDLITLEEWNAAQ